MAKKARAIKLPKRLAGVKVPKALRKKGNKLFASPVGQTLLMEALAAATAAIVAHEAGPNSTSRKLGKRSGAALASMKEQALDAADSAGGQVNAFQQAARAAAEAFSRTLQESRSFHAEQGDLLQSEPAVGSKKKSGYGELSPAH